MTTQPRITVAGFNADRAQIMTEKVLQTRVEQLLRVFGWRWFHTYNSQRSEAGFPDVCAVRRGRLLFAELKTERGRLTGPQKGWLDDLQTLNEVARLVEEDPNTAQIGVYLWRPTDLLSGEIERVLR